MISRAEREYIEEYAYLPEHIPQYVIAISQTEPFLFGDFLTYAKEDRLIFVGYPLKETFDEERMRSTLEEAIKHFKPESISLIVPSIPPSLNDCIQSPPDHYYRLDLSTLSISQKLRNMLNRAGRELSVEKSRDFSKEHQKLIKDFLKSHPVDDATRSIFKKIGKYLSSSTTAWVFDTRNKQEELVAFDIAEYKPRDYAIYMFNFSSEAQYVPGASDLLLLEVTKQAKTEKKKYINLGLGINPGVTFFKKKWGGVIFLPHTSCLFCPQRKENLEVLLQKL
jgi:hypothetical protein